MAAGQLVFGHEHQIAFSWHRVSGAAWPAGSTAQGGSGAALCSASCTQLGLAAALCHVCFHEHSLQQKLVLVEGSSDAVFPAAALGAPGRCWAARHWGHWLGVAAPGGMLCAALGALAAGGAA